MIASAQTAYFHLFIRVYWRSFAVFRFILNPEVETHAKDAMNTKEGTYKSAALTIGVTRFLSNPLRISGLARFAPFA